MIVKRGKSYQVRVNGFAARTVYSREAANKLETSLKNRRVLGDIYEAAPSTLDTELNGYDERRATKTFSPRTLEEQKQIAKAWKPLRGMLVPSLNRQIIEDAFSARARIAPVMADKELRHLKRALRESASRGQRIDRAIFDIAPINAKPKRGRALSIDQLFALQAWLPEYVRRIVPLAGMEGARQAFWFALDETMFDLDEMTMLAPAELQKNGRDHRVYLTPLEASLLREQLLARPAGTALMFPTPTGKMWSRSNFHKYVWRNAVEAAAVTDPVFDAFKFHWLRKTAGSLMALSGLDPASAAERLGHTDGGALFLKTYRFLYEQERKRHADQFGAWIASEVDRSVSHNTHTRAVAE